MRQAFVVMLLLAVLPLSSLRTAAAQFISSMEGGARAMALGGAATALPAHVWGVANPAAWATLPARAVAFHAGQAFGMSALRLGAVQYAEVRTWGAVAGGARTFGFDDFRRSAFHVGYARGFTLGTTRSFYGGLALRYYQLSLGGGYGSAGAVGLSAGGLARLLPSLHLGFHAANLNAPKAGGRAALPQTLAVGLAYAAGERFLVLLDAFKDLDYPVSVRAGLEVHPVEALALRVGAATQPTRFSAGVGVHVGALRAHVAPEQPPALGWSPAAPLGLQW